MGTTLARFGFDSFPLLANMEDPRLVESIHKSCLDSGAEIILTNTFMANTAFLKNNHIRYSQKQVIERAVDIAFSAGQKNYDVWGCVSPSGLTLPVWEKLAEMEKTRIFSDSLSSFAQSRIKTIIYETFFNREETYHALKAAREFRDHFQFVLSFSDHQILSQIFADRSLLNLISDLKIRSLGINCFNDFTDGYKVFSQLWKKVELPLLLKPNGNALQYLGDDALIQKLDALYQLGVRYFGGCCQTDETWISLLHNWKKG